MNVRWLPQTEGGKPSALVEETVVAKKILIIDDDPIFLKLVDQVLYHKGYEMLKAISGHEGLRLLFTEKPDLAFTLIK